MTIQTRMRALVAAPKAKWKAELREVDAPVCGRTEALIEVAAFSVNRGELMLLDKVPDGWVGGWDLAGHVKVAATDGSGPPVGARVLGYLPRHGGWAELAAVPTTQLAVIPDAISFPDAIGLAVPGVVALRVIRAAGSIAGKQLLATGAFLGGGRILLQLTKLGGATTTVVLNALPAPGFDDELRSFGADEVLIGAEALLASGRQFDPILEAAGGTITNDVFDLVRPGGTIVCFGNSTGLPTTFRLEVFNKKQPTMIGFYMPTSTEEFPVREDLETLFRLTLEGKISASVGKELPWEESDAALESLSGYNWGGKMILHVR